MSLDIQHDAANTRFVASVEGGEAVLQYKHRGHQREGVFDLISTYVPKEARGNDVGSELVGHVLDWAASKGKKIIPTCPFIANYLEENPEYQDLLADPAVPVSDREKRPIGTQVMVGDDAD